MKKMMVVCFGLLMLTGCAGFNNSMAEKTKATEYYRIFDIKTDAKRQIVAKAASEGLGANTSDINENMSIPNFTTPPEQPGRFKLVDPFQGMKMGPLAMMAGGGNRSMKVATCEDAVWTANAKKTIKGSSDLTLTACLFQYQDGYHLDMYASFVKQEGGFLQVSRAMAAAMVGTPEEWTEKTFLDVVRAVQRKTAGEITFLEGYPEIEGTPWLDSGETYSKVSE